MVDYFISIWIVTTVVGLVGYALTRGKASRIWSYTHGRMFEDSLNTPFKLILGWSLFAETYIYVCNA
jgi:hypothetical protein